MMFPNGVKRPGYVVPDAATEQKMRRNLMWVNIGRALITGIAMMAAIRFFGRGIWTPMTWAIAVVSPGALIILYRITLVKLLTRGITPWSGGLSG